ncbi:MAG: hypothetical protein Q9223_000507 [Gallowayella weberi]
MNILRPGRLVLPLSSRGVQGQQGVGDDSTEEELEGSTTSTDSSLASRLANRNARTSDSWATNANMTSPSTSTTTPSKHSFERRLEEVKLSKT